MLFSYLLYILGFTGRAHLSLLFPLQNFTRLCTHKSQLVCDLVWCLRLMSLASAGFLLFYFFNFLLFQNVSFVANLKIGWVCEKMGSHFVGIWVQSCQLMTMIPWDGLILNGAAYRWVYFIPQPNGFSNCTIAILGKFSSLSLKKGKISFQLSYFFKIPKLPRSPFFLYLCC